MDIFAENEIRILKDYRQMAITTTEHGIYMRIIRYMSEGFSTSTYRIARHLRCECREARKFLRKMEGRGYVIADSNGSNNICWVLKP